MDIAESKYIDKKTYRSKYVAAGKPAAGAQEGQLSPIHEDLLKFIPFLTRRCGLEFRGRILEIGAGIAWLSAELSRLPRVVEVIATDFAPGVLKDEAPKVFQSLKANPAKITRTPGDFHQLDFPDNYFDFVVCSAALHQAVNMVQVLREVKRVLKPGGHFVAIREPVWPLAKLTKRQRAALVQGEATQAYTLGHYQELFRQASLPMIVKRVNLSSGFKYYVNKVVNRMTSARYAFIGRKRGFASTTRNVRDTLLNHLDRWNSSAARTAASSKSRPRKN